MNLSCVTTEDVIKYSGYTHTQYTASEITVVSRIQYLTFCTRSLFCVSVLVFWYGSSISNKEEWKKTSSKIFLYMERSELKLQNLSQSAWRSVNMKGREEKEEEAVGSCRKRVVIIRDKRMPQSEKPTGPKLTKNLQLIWILHTRPWTCQEMQQGNNREKKERPALIIKTALWKLIHNTLHSHYARTHLFLLVLVSNTHFSPGWHWTLSQYTDLPAKKRKIYEFVIDWILKSSGFKSYSLKVILYLFRQDVTMPRSDS
jgi:hypothetical protein